MRQQRTKRRAMAEINVVPYIDVMLVLLVIFMVTAPLLQQGVQVSLPKAQAKALNSKQQEPIIVSVDAQGKFYLNVAENPEVAMSPQEIAIQVAAELQLAKQKNENRNVLVKGDKNVDYGSVVTAMVLLQKAGVNSVGLMTQSPDSVTANRA